MQPVISVDAAHLKSASKGTTFIYSGNDETYILAFGISGGNDDYRTWNIFSSLFAKHVHQCHLWKTVMHIQSSHSFLTGIKVWISHS